MSETRRPQARNRQANAHSGGVWRTRLETDPWFAVACGPLFPSKKRIANPMPDVLDLNKALEFLGSIVRFERYPWLGSVFAIVFATLLANYVARLALNRLEARFARTRSVWDDALLAAVRRPFTLLIWILGFSLAAQIVALEMDSDLTGLINAAREVLVISMLAWFLISFISQVEERVMSPKYGREPVDRTTALAVGKLLRSAVVITAGLMIMQTLGFSVSGVLAAGGIGGIAIGFAAKDMLANFFGAMVIFLDRPFAVGDWIRSPDKQIEGTVENIGWRMTRIRTFDKRPLYVPNAVFTQISVENPSRMLHRRIYETFGLRYEDVSVLPQIISDVKAMLANHPDIEQGQTQIINFDNIGASTLNFFVYVFTKTTNWVEYHGIKQDVLLKIFAIVHEHGADLAFPTTTLDLPPAGVEALARQWHMNREAAKEHGKRPGDEPGAGASE